ncbi:hypothetical protein [Segniliparus rotundus]|uniref:hypothetical protein n=1 Tax=Segniliparus rotundus TaxID=286802 RepID=UPI0002E3D02C|nr:hypothetical protein [Segniliparus rotundus]
MELNVEDARKAGRATLDRAGVIRSDPTPGALRGVLEAGAGFDAAEAFVAVADNYREYCGRCADGYEWLGHSVVSGADQIGATDEDGAALIEESGVGV